MEEDVIPNPVNNVLRVKQTVFCYYIPKGLVVWPNKLQAFECKIK